ncbi:MAG: DUF488 family protein [Acidiferrobacterales bacterium]
MSIHLKRVYEQPKRGDGYRVLVDGLWPRGVNRGTAKIDLWLKEIAPSGELRKWFDHDPKKWSQFKTRYFRELNKNSETVAGLAKKAENRRVTLLFAARDMEHNNAVAFRVYLEREFGL